MHLIRNFFSGLFSFFLVMSLVMLIILVSFTNVFFSKEAFLSTLEKNKTYEGLANQVLPNFILVMILRGDGEKPYNQSDVDKIIDKIEPQQLKDIEAQIQSIFENGYLYVLGEKDTFEEKIELASSVGSIKASLAAAATQLNQTGEVTSITPEQINQGLPTDQNYTLILTQDKTVLVTPSGESIENTSAQTSNNQASLQTLREIIGGVKQTQNIFLGSAILLGFLLLLSRLPNWVDSLKWVAGALFSAGIFPLVLSVIFLAVKPVTYLEKFLADHPEFSIPDTVRSTLTLNLADLLDMFLVNLRLYSAILVVIAVVIYGSIWFAHLLKNQHHPRALDTERLKS